MTFRGQFGRLGTVGTLLVGLVVATAAPALADPPPGATFTRGEGLALPAGVSVSLANDAHLALVGSRTDDALGFYIDENSAWHGGTKLWNPYSGGDSGNAMGIISSDTSTVAGYFTDQFDRTSLNVWRKKGTGYQAVMGASPASGIPVSISADGKKVLTTSNSPTEMRLLTISGGSVSTLRILQTLPTGTQGRWSPTTAQLSADGSSMAIAIPGGVEVLKASESWSTAHVIVPVAVTGFAYSHDGSTIATVTSNGTTSTAAAYRTHLDGTWFRSGSFTAPSTAGVGVQANSVAVSSGGLSMVVGWHAKAGLYRYVWDGSAWHFGGSVNNTQAERDAGATGLAVPYVSPDGHRIIGLATTAINQDLLTFDAP
jgi:hypothetical protein